MGARDAPRARTHTQTHTTRTHQRIPKRHTYKGWASATHSACRKKKGGWDPYTYSQPPAGRRRDRATDRYTTHEHARTTERKKKREKEEKKNTPPTHTDTLRHIQAKQRKGTSQCQAERPDAHGRRTQKRDAAGGDEKKKKRKKKRGRDGRRRPPLLPPPHAAAVPAVSSRCLHPLYNAAAGGLTNRRPTSRHTSAASAARRSRQ